jgi:hypothetical protein
MTRIKHIYARGHGKRDPNVAIMSAIANGRYLNYFPSRNGKEKLGGWRGGVDVEWETDDATGMPVWIHLTPATSGGLPLKPHDQPTYIAFATSQFGRAVVGPARQVEEIINTNTIAVKVSFAFRRSDDSDE